jgi:cytochrome P450
MAFLLLAAGFETTVHLLAGSVLALLEHPEQKARLLTDWSIVPTAVEELLRFVSPVQITKPRWASRDLVFHGQPLSRGDPVIAQLAAANADPERFETPEQLDLGRTPNPHFGFGTGPHVCLGAQLARVETQVVIEHLFKRFPNLSLAVSAVELRYLGRIGLRSLRTLPVRLG